MLFKRRKKKIILSQGEARCGQRLRERCLSPIPQYRIAPLPRYRFDYYFIYKDREYLLEFDGKQHFEETPWFHRSRRSFYKQRNCDFLKTVVALMSGYCLIRIAYNDINRLDEILDEALQGQESLYLSNREMYRHLLERPIPKTWIEKYGQYLDLPRRRIVIRRNTTLH